MTIRIKLAGIFYIFLALFLLFIIFQAIFGLTFKTNEYENEVIEKVSSESLE